MCCSTFEVRPGRSGDKSESHRTVRTPTNKTSEALVRRQGTYDLLTESLTLDQLCGVRSDNAAVRNCLRGLERHITGIATKRHFCYGQQKCRSLSLRRLAAKASAVPTELRRCPC